MGIIIILILIYFKDTNLTNKITSDSELASMHYLYFKEQKKSILEYHQFPLWSTAVYAGTPLFALPQSSTLFVNGFIPILFIKNLELGINLIAINNSILAALFMYLLCVIGFRLKPKYAFISAVLFVFNWVFLGTTPSWIGRNKVMMYTPLFFLLCMLALRKRNFVRYSLLAGIVFALQFHGGGVDYFMLGLIIPLTFFSYESILALLKRNYAKLTKIVLVGVIMLIVFVGLITVQLMPMNEFKPYSSKSAGFDYRRSIGKKLLPEKILTFPYNSEDVDASTGGTRIGTIALILFSGSLLIWKKKRVIFFYILIIFSLLLATGTKFYYPFWRFVPGFTAIHNVLRVLFVTEFAIAALVGLGACVIFDKIEKTKFKKYSNFLFWFVALLLVVDLTLVPYSKLVHRDKNVWILKDGVAGTANANELTSYLSKQPGLFRVHNIRNNEIAGWTPMYIAAHNLSELMGTASVWITEHLNVYLSVAHNSPAKFWGMLNAKYIYSEDLLNESDIPERYKKGLKFVQKFKECDICKENPPQDHGVDGPYLYENELYLPRAILVNNSIFIEGTDEIGGNGQQLMYGILLMDNFTPANTVLVMRRKQNKQSNKELLQKFDYILLTQNIDPILMQDSEINKRIIKSNDMLLDIISSFNGVYKEMPITYYSPNKLIINLNKEKGFLVLAEKYFLFPGWTAVVNGKEKELFRANGINTAIHLNGEEGDLIITYKPKSFIIGATISIITLALIFLYFSYLFIMQIINKRTAKG